MNLPQFQNIKVMLDRNYRDVVEAGGCRTCPLAAVLAGFVMVVRRRAQTARMSVSIQRRGKVQKAGAIVELGD